MTGNSLRHGRAASRWLKPGAANWAPALLAAFIVALIAPGAAAVLDESVSYIIIETETGLVIDEYQAGLRRPPASMVKMMHMLLVAEGLVEGAWTLDDTITVTPKAASITGSRVNLRAGEEFTLNQLMRAVAIVSANDAAMAVAEGLWGSEDACLQAMNRRAQELGMEETVFYSVHGLPPDDDRDFDQSTARDMAILAQQCVEHPLILGWSRERELQFRPGESVRYNTNKLLWRMDDCDGLKTGYIRAAGWCLTATARRDDVRLLTVVMGTRNSNARVLAAHQLLEEGFSKVRRVTVLKMADKVEPPVPVKNSENLEVALSAADDLSVVVLQSDLERLRLVAEMPVDLAAPMRAGEIVGRVAVQLDETVLAASDLVLPVDLTVASWRWKLQQSVLQGRRAASRSPSRL